MLNVATRPSGDIQTIITRLLIRRATRPCHAPRRCDWSHAVKNHEELDSVVALITYQRSVWEHGLDKKVAFIAPMIPATTKWPGNP